LIVSFTVPVDARSQSQFGIKAGFGLANLTGDISGNKSMLGFGGGGFARFSTSPQLVIQTEALLVMKGTKEDNGGAGGSEEKLKLTYIEIPFLFMFQPQTEGSVAPSFFAGPAVGLLVSASAAGVDVKDAFNTADFGLVFGGGAEFGSGEKGKFTVDARYTLGLANIAKDSGDLSVKNGVLMFMVGYLFP
jgi:hypothetical protein